MKYFLITGEPSGDQHGSSLMKAILRTDPAAEFRFLGGDLMERVGGIPVIHIRDMAFMGFTQIVFRLFRIRRNFVVCRRAILDFDPDVVIPVDYGGFNLRMIKWLNRMSFRSVYYITPKVWAWMPSRAAGLARFTQKALCVLPFEEPFLRQYGVDAQYVGNPVLEYVTPVSKRSPDDIMAGLGLSAKPVVALLPGSRRQEIAGMLPLMARVAEKFPDYQFVIAGHANFPEPFYAELTKGRHLPVVYGSTLELLKVANAAVINSGTATLEAALLGTPQVVCYRTNTISYLIARFLIRVEYISLVNLILGKPCLKELIQRGCNDRNVERELSSLLNDEGYRKEVLSGYRDLETLIGAGNASATAAAVICRVASSARQV